MLSLHVIFHVELVFHVGHACEPSCCMLDMDGNPHVVHGTKINELCVACHGEEFANKYLEEYFKRFSFVEYFVAKIE